jgi:precorrin-2 dehydrogenase/sirohydrochlorin ferrochelatase
MSLFPMFLKLEGRKCLVVGAGKIGESKIRSLLVSKANVHVVAPWATPTVTAWDRVGVLRWSAREFHPTDLDNVFLVVAATSVSSVNDTVYHEAELRRVLCNVVDVPDRCDFYYPAVVRRGDLQVAISTGGNSPALAQKLRRQFERQLTPLYAGWLARLGNFRKDLFSRRLDPGKRRALLHAVAKRGPFANPTSDTSVARGGPHGR